MRYRDAAGRFLPQHSYSRVPHGRESAAEKEGADALWEHEHDYARAAAALGITRESLYAREKSRCRRLGIMYAGRAKARVRPVKVLSLSDVAA